MQYNCLKNNEIKKYFYEEGIMTKVLIRKPQQKCTNRMYYCRGEYLNEVAAILNKNISYVEYYCDKNNNYLKGKNTFPF